VWDISLVCESNDMKKNIFILLLLITLTLSACVKKEKYIMDRQAEDGKYHYSNSGLGFLATLPEEFVYYQTQRLDNTAFNEVQFFVPTNDKEYASEVAGYAKAFFVRVYDEKNWDNLADAQDLFYKFAKKKNKVYVVKFWDKPPSDWVDRWTDDLKEKVERSLKLK